MRLVRIALLASTAVLAFSSAGQAADLAILEPTTFAAEPAGGSWDGFYIGIHGGFASGLADHQPVTAPPAPYANGYDINIAGGFAGIQVGGNFYLSDTIVGGVEADISLARITGSLAVGVGPIGTLTYDVNWMGSIRARIGYDGGAYMPYLTGGLAVANATRTNSAGAGTSSSATYLGWTVGAGVEIAATEQLSFNVEYRYSDYGAQSFVTGGTSPSIKLTDHQVRLGLNYRF